MKCCQILRNSHDSQLLLGTVQIPKAWYSRLCDTCIVLLLFVPLWGKDLGLGARPVTAILPCDLGQGVDHLQVSVSPSVRFLQGIYEALRVRKHKASQRLSSAVSPSKCLLNLSLRHTDYGRAFPRYSSFLLDQSSSLLAGLPASTRPSPY